MTTYEESIKNEYARLYATNWFKMKEGSGTTIRDSKSSVVGTINGATWSSDGGLNFDGVDDYVLFNSNLNPIGKKTISIVLAIDGKPNSTQMILCNDEFDSSKHGFRMNLMPDGSIQWIFTKGGAPSRYGFTFPSSLNITDGNKHRLTMTWDGTTNDDSVKYYFDNILIHTTKSILIESVFATQNLTMGARLGNRVFDHFFKGKVYELSVWNEDISKLKLNKTLILTEGKYKTYSNGWIDTTNQSPTSVTFLSEGMDAIPTFINEITSDFEIVNWTDEIGVNKKLEIIDAIPSPQFIHTTTLFDITGSITSLLSSDLSSISTASNVRYLLTDNNITWKKWNGSDFTNVTFNTIEDILTVGMTYDEITAISDWSKWNSNKINIGVYLQDSDTTKSKVGTLGFTENSPKDSSTLSNVNFYILNTTAKIELDLQGLLLSGQLSDLDSTRVQYKVTLNGQPYYPLSGGYTSLSPSPQNIEIAFKSSEIKMNDWNTLRVDFKDYFGTEDYWQTTFVGNYSALMFMDTDGNYYSDDIGKVLQYLDFGTIVAGEVTVAHEVVIKNQYGYAVKDLQLEASRSNLPEGVDIQLSKVDDPFESEQSLLFEDGLDFEEQTSFYVRMVTDVDSVPNDTKSFNIFVKASRKGV